MNFHPLILEPRSGYIHDGPVPLKKTIIRQKEPKTKQNKTTKTTQFSYISSPFAISFGIKVPNHLI